MDLRSTCDLPKPLPRSLTAPAQRLSMASPLLDQPLTTQLTASAVFAFLIELMTHKAGKYVCIKRRNPTSAE